MSTPETRLSRMSAADRAAAIAAAAAALRGGAPVVLPTDTVYSLAIAAGSPRAAEVAGRFGAYAERCGEPSPLAWNPATLEGVPGLLGLRSATHRRLISRLTPGPVIFAVAVTPEVLAAVAATLGCDEATLDRKGAGEVALRRVGDGAGREVIEGAGETGVLVAEIPLGSGKRGAGGWALDAAEARAAVGEALGTGWESDGGVLLDDGRSKPGRPATILSLGGGATGGGWEIRRPGAYEERFVRKQLHRNILFICTGNTCRSPMAEAIASRLVSEAPEGMLPTTVMSAGTGAHTGSPPTPEAVEALREMGIEPALRGSRALTRQMIAEADAIFAMSRSHLQAVLAFDPTAAGKAVLLDPEGRDVPDPIGGPPEVYTETASRIADLVTARLRELDA